jgi:putative transcriptional regulator
MIRDRSRIRRFLWMAAAAALLYSSARSAPAQSTQTHALAAGKFLVASRDLLDPNFVETVVLLVRYEEDGVVGLIINRRTRIPIARLFPELLDSIKGRSDPLYTGGPVARTMALALLRSRARLEGVEPVFADVSLVSSKSLLQKTMAAGTGPATFRLYAGYSGWTARQLQGEVELGGWHIFPGDPSMVFDPDPESVWSRLIRKTEQRIARSPAPLSALALKALVQGNVER